MNFTDGVVIDVTHHVDDFAGYGFFRTGAEIFFSVLRRIMCKSERRRCKRGDYNNGEECFETFEAS
jgi:hypothetical protein